MQSFRPRYKRNNKIITWVNRTHVQPVIYHDGVLWGRGGRYLQKSEDGWRTFTQVHDFGLGTQARDILGISESRFIVGVDNKIMLTTDNGTTFTNVLTATESGSTFGLVAFAKSNIGTLFAATYGTKTPSNSEVFRSTDDGATWSKILDLVDDFSIFNSEGTHIHGIKVDPYNSDVWLLIGDTPNSAIMRCPGDKEPSIPSNWEILSHATENPLSFDGYPDDIRHQPIDGWFDQDYAYFSNDQVPWSVKAYNKNTGEWSLPLDYTDYGMPNMQSGAYGLTMGAETSNYFYHGSRANIAENPSHLWRMSKKTREWEHLWGGFPSPTTGTHGVLKIINIGDKLVIVWQYPNGGNFIGHIPTN